MLINRLAVQIWAFGAPELSRSGDSSHKPQRVGRDGQVREEALRAITAGLATARMPCGPVRACAGRGAGVVI
jgi:hypothetical protein